MAAPSQRPESNSKRRGRLPSAACLIFELDDLLYALENAAEFLENEEWPETETKSAQEAANREGAKQIRQMVARLISKSNDERTRGANKA